MSSSMLQPRPGRPNNNPRGFGGAETGRGEMLRQETGRRGCLVRLPFANNNYYKETIVFNNNNNNNHSTGLPAGLGLRGDTLRRGLLPPLRGGRLAWPAPRAWDYPNPAFPPYTVRTLHFHGGPATEDTTRTGACAALALILRGASSPQDPEAAPEQPRGPQMSPGHRAVRSRSCSKPAAKIPSKLILAAPAIAPYVRGAAQNLLGNHF